MMQRFWKDSCFWKSRLVKIADGHNKERKSEGMAKRILVVDDDEMSLKMAELMLMQEGYEVYTAESGMDCLNYLKDNCVELILLDIEMPIMNGIKTFEILKDNKGMMNIPVVFLTASADSEMVLEAGKLGAVDYITKPFLPQELLKRVERALG